jgi:Nas2 N_terminal domain
MHLKLTVNNQHGVNMSTSLTTFDGYPRDDIDVAQSTYDPSICQNTVLTIG